MTDWFCRKVWLTYLPVIIDSEDTGYPNEYILFVVKQGVFRDCKIHVDIRKSSKECIESCLSSEENLYVILT